MENLEQILPKSDSIISKDLRLNLVRLLSEGALDKIEAHFALLAVATSAKAKGLQDYAQGYLKEAGINAAEIQEARESAAIMGMLNTYYKFRHMVQKPDDYKTASLRMTALAKPVLGKHKFEMLAFAVSVLNGCETCIRSHEEVLRQADTSVEKIHDLARLASVVKGLSAFAED